MIFEYPYTDMHELNLDWFLAKFKELVETWNNVESDWNDLHDYVQHYFENLNVQTEINNKINAMILDGTFADIVSPFVTAALPALVAGQLPDVVAAQISSVVAAQISAVVADQLPAVAAAAAAAEVGDWLAAHIDPDTGYVIDDTLTVQNAAADAKTVGDALSNVNGVISDHDIKLNKLLFTYDYTSGIGYIGTDGDVHANASLMYKKTSPIICEEGQKFYYKGKGEYSTVSWIFYNGTSIVSYGQANSTTNYTEVTVPSGVDNIVFASYDSTADVDDVILELKYEAFTNDEKQAIQDNIGALQMSDCDAKFITFDIELGTNLYNQTWYIDGQYIKGADLMVAAGYQTTSIIYLPQGDYLVNCRKSKYGINATWYRYYDKDGNLLSTHNASIIIDDSNNSVMLITVDADDVGIMFNIDKNENTMILRGDTSDDWSSTYIPFNPDKKVIDTEFHFNSAQKTEIENVSNPLFSKYISADGDSISSGIGYAGGYAKIISDDNSMTYENLSVSGATLAAETYRDGSPRHWICRSMQNITTDADYILIEGGVNDSSLGVTLGSLTSGYNAALDDTTFYGALETIFKTLITKYVGKKYVFIIPHQMTEGMLPGAVYYNAIMTAASKWGIKVLDLTQSIPPFSFMRNTETYNTIRTAYTVSGDGWHPTELCYIQYYVPQIEASLKTL